MEQKCKLKEVELPETQKWNISPTRFSENLCNDGSEVGTVSLLCTLIPIIKMHPTILYYIYPRLKKKTHYRFSRKKETDKYLFR